MGTPKEVKVGAFVLLGMIVAGMVTFMIGSESALFSSKDQFHTTFTDVQGLKAGSPVRMGGIDVGSVDAVRYAQDPKDARLHVTLNIVSSEKVRIRQDSIVSIANKGLLGDKMVVIEVGSADKPAIPAGGTIKSQDPEDFTAVFSKIGPMADKAEGVLINLEKGTAPLADKKFQEDLKQTVASLSGILKAVDKGDGYASRFLHDKSEADKLSRTLSNVERSTRRLDGLLSGLNTTVRRVNTGPGFAHEMVYGETGTKTVGRFGDAANELAVTLRGVREGNGIARSVIYGDDQSQEVMGNINKMTKDMRKIVAGIRAGKGTIGALLVDPSVYEDLKMLFGNVQRNQVLRALVRYSIKRDEKIRPVQVKDPGPAGAAGVPTGKNSAPKPGSLAVGKNPSGRRSIPAQAKESSPAADKAVKPLPPAAK